MLFLIIHLHKWQESQHTAAESQHAHTTRKVQTTNKKKQFETTTNAFPFSMSLFFSLHFWWKVTMAQNGLTIWRGIPVWKVLSATLVHWFLRSFSMLKKHMHDCFGSIKCNPSSERRKERSSCISHTASSVLTVTICEWCVEPVLLTKPFKLVCLFKSSTHFEPLWPFIKSEVRILFKTKLN